MKGQSQMASKTKASQRLQKQVHSKASHLDNQNRGKKALPTNSLKELLAGGVCAHANTLPPKHTRERLLET